MQPVSHIVKQKTGPDDPELLDTLQNAMSQVAAEDLVAVADDLVARHTRFAQRFGTANGAPAPGTVTVNEHELIWISRAVTSTRKHAAILVEKIAARDLASIAQALLHGSGEAGDRVASCLASLDGLDPRLGLEFATGLLHYTFPQDHWLWMRWMWDTTKRTGILPLLAGSVHNLAADSVAEEYTRVGSVTAMSMRFAEGTGLLVPELIRHPHRSLFAADVFLAAAYSIYLYGITSWRLSREFNNLLPTLPNMMRRLLGLPKAANG